MTKKGNWLTFVLLAGASVAGGCTADAPEPGALTGPSSAAPADVVRTYLTDRGVDPAMLRVVRDHRSARTGVTHVRVEQEVDGLRVVGAYVKAAVDDQGRLTHLIDRLAPVPAGGLVAVTGGEAQAISAAISHLGITSAFAELPSAEPVAYVDDAGVLRAGYRVETWTVDNLLHHTIVDAAGRVVSVELRTNTDRYNVFLEDPGKGAQTIVDGPGAGNAESPIGWLFAGPQRDIEIRGNNVRAYLDADNNNRPDRGGVTEADGEFLTVADLTVSPSTAANQAVATQNLFYLNNVVHDLLYRHGFTEAAGNFQEDNFDLGGRGRDSVNAEAQDGGGTDNANFATPPDGRHPRMQMYLWTGPGPTHQVAVTAPASVAGSYDGAGAVFGPAFTETGVGGNIVVVDDGLGASATDGCEAIQNDVAGAIALVDRGTCNFTVKVLNAQTAGAAAVIVANNQGGTAYFTMGGEERRIRIPSMMIGQNDGALLKGAAGVVGTARLHPNPPLQLDGDLDSDIVFHEYGHGLTWRMIGGMSGPLAGAVGEGASDTLAFLINGDDRVGEYSFSNPAGIRRFPYAGYPNTYGDVTGAGVHNDGEIFAAAMWRLSELFAGAGLTNDDLLGYFVDGMNYTPATPAYEDLRDGMIQSATAAQRPDVVCLIWEAFAQFGIGEGADGSVTDGVVTITESFVVPASCP